VMVAGARGVTSASLGTSRKESGMAAEEYWFCLKHHTVEGEEGCKSADRLGPYATSAEASRALDKVQERNENWDNDPDWNDDVPRPTE
jgi:hypothetical protein